MFEYICVLIIKHMSLQSAQKTRWLRLGTKLSEDTCGSNWIYLNCCRGSLVCLHSYALFTSKLLGKDLSKQHIFSGEFKSISQKNDSWWSIPFFLFQIARSKKNVNIAPFQPWYSKALSTSKGPETRLARLKRGTDLSLGLQQSPPQTMRWLGSKHI